MAGFLLRRLLLMVPTFVGITLVTFGIATVAGDPLRAGLFDPDALPRHRLSREEARRLRESLGLDQPAVFNTDVQDRRRSVERAVERVVAIWDAAGPGGPVGEARGEAQDLLEELARGGALTLVYLPGRLERLGVSERSPAWPALIDAAVRAAREPLRSFEDLKTAAAARHAAGTPEAVGRGVARWLAAFSDVPPDPARLALLTEELHRLGGLAVPELVDRLGAAPPWVRAAGADFLQAHTAFDGAYPAGLAPGRPLTAAEAAQVEMTDRRLDRWWRQNRLRYTEISDFRRWAWSSWTQTRYAQWLGRVVRLEFGDSLVYRRPVGDLLAERVPITLLMQGASVILMYLFAVPIGVWCALRRGRLVERGATLVLFLLYAAPDFWLATLGVLYLHPAFPIDGLRAPEIAAALRDGTLSGWSWAALSDLAWHLCLPVGVLALGGIAVLSRYGRVGMLEVLRQDWIRTARAKGLPEKVVIRRHAVRNGMLPLVTLFGAMLPALVGGSVVVERVFNIPGLGLLAWDAAQNSDLPVAMAVVTLTALLTMAGYLLTDVLYGILDPRVARA